MIKNNKNTVGIEDNDAAVEALTFEDLNEVSLPMSVDDPILHTMPN